MLKCDVEAYFLKVYKNKDPQGRPGRISIVAVFQVEKGHLAVTSMTVLYFCCDSKVC